MDVTARITLGNRARASVLDGYTLQAMRDATLDVYEAVLTGQIAWDAETVAA